MAIIRLGWKSFRIFGAEVWQSLWICQGLLVSDTSWVLEIEPCMRLSGKKLETDLIIGNIDFFHHGCKLKRRLTQRRQELLSTKWEVKEMSSQGHIFEIPPRQSKGNGLGPATEKFASSMARNVTHSLHPTKSWRLLCVIAPP